MLKRGPTEAVNGATQMPFALQVLVDHYKRKPPSSTSMVRVLSWHLLVKPAPSPRCTTT